MATLQVRDIDDEIYNIASQKFKKMGMNKSTAVKMFFFQVANEKRNPFGDLTINGFSREEEKNMLSAWKKEENEGPFSTMEDLLADIKS